jgi:phosphonate transport system substrate-binding protein
MLTCTRRLLALACLLLGAAAQAQGPATNCPRGQLDAAYCDANGDLVADAPARTLNPDKLVLGVSSVEDAMTASKTFGPLVQYLSGCLRKEVLLYPPVAEAAVLEGMRTGQVHIGQFTTGGTMFAVNFAGAVPFAGKGHSAKGGRDTYTLMLIVRADGPYRKPADLVGKRIAHTTVTSNSGNLAPRVLFPPLGLTPEKDYKVEFSGKHDKSILGVQLGLYDGAAIASDVLQRLVDKGEVKASQFRVLYESGAFPPDAFSFAHNLDPRLADNIRKCFVDFRYPEGMSRLVESNDRFYPVNYAADWKLVREIAQASAAPLDRAAYDRHVAARK